MTTFFLQSACKSGQLLAPARGARKSTSCGSEHAAAAPPHVVSLPCRSTLCPPAATMSCAWARVVVGVISHKRQIVVSKPETIVIFANDGIILCKPRTGFAAESGQIRTFQTFKV